MKRLLLSDVFAFFFYVITNAAVVDLKQLEGINMPLVQIETVNGEMPTYTEVMHPSDGMGVSITDATKVPARMIISKGLGGDMMYDSGDYAKDESGETINLIGSDLYASLLTALKYHSPSGTGSYGSNSSK